ncbi:porin [Tardiphaga sp. 538_B7_N1_4]|uniref:porin n=1 Tax=Tardiphaga sp. 538_B7_N1_4 TaxID=3240778 RepID=UPI001B8A3BE5|nr:porin [Bradyrhizobium diazoefficiens]MBR0967347.1 porin [Bradyrhizobium diazoefficiens]MBR0976668.1 porin [Bradyrhizobium diazoefficiens]MBR1005313.1 porin [Bradyrhizobium diazoefficiens]MBR1011786.1 porin [Bradyrhizobium diazoefficiens]MBR1049127.1 porin [Bradyrhizobium diazoefficiens]
MNIIKTLVLGAAAGLATISGAQAADLPTKAKAVQYVKICSVYGAGFYYIPGTDTCIKLGSYTQIDVNLNGGNYGKPAWDQQFNLGTHSRDAEYFTTRARVQLNIDTRTATDYGIVRTYWTSTFNHSSGDGPSTGTLSTDYAFVQFAGFTLGKAVSGFQTPWGAYAGNNTAYLLGGSDTATGITQIAYTWQFGNGVSAQIGIEDSRTLNRAQLLNAGYALTAAQANTAISTGAFPTANGGNAVPDIAGNIKIDQASFTAQLSAAAHTLHGTYYGATSASAVEPNGHPSDVWGGAVQGGLQLKNLPTGLGDKFSLEGVYANGAMKYIIGGVTGNNFDSFSGGGSLGGYQNFAVLTLADGIFTNGGSIEKTTGWGVRANFVHNWSPTWESTVFGTYTHIDYNAAATNAFCAQRAAVVAGGPATNALANATCNPDFNIWQVGSRLAWTPAQNLTFSAEILYTMLDQSHGGSVVAPTNGMGAFKPAGTYDFHDQGMFTGNLRVRRTW